jgi:hypothetical protein
MNMYIQWRVYVWTGGPEIKIDITKIYSKQKNHVCA